MKNRSKRQSFQTMRRKEKKNPTFINENSPEWKNRSPFVIGYSVPEGTTPEQELLWVSLLKEAHFESLGKKEFALPKSPKYKKIKHKVKISLIGTEL